MIPAPGVEGHKIALFGLGSSGRAAARALIAGGGHVFAWDDSKQARKQAEQAGLSLHDLSNSDWTQFSSLVLAPGVPLTHPEPHWTVLRAKEAGVEIIGDTEIFMRALQEYKAQDRLIAITGTNGKSTTTALIAHIFANAGYDAQIGGNIGTPVLELSPPQENTIYVIEFSSYQIDLSPSLKPHIGILLNLSPDHLDRHGTLDHYADVKARIFSRQGAQDFAVIGADDALTNNLAGHIETKAKRVRISTSGAIENGVYVTKGMLCDAIKGKAKAKGDLLQIGSLRGRHNWQNAAAAYMAARAYNIKPDIIFQGLTSFPGLAHRMEQVAGPGKIMFINDSKATNVDACARALSSFKRVYWIAGGLAKQGGIEALEAYFPAIKKAYLIGAAAPLFSHALKGSVVYEISETLDEAVKAAYRDASKDKNPEPIILFSPAAASFDQYRNFEIRGEAFKAAISRLRPQSIENK